MPLQIFPTRAELGAGVPRPFSAAGGVEPYVFSVEGKGYVDPATGIYTAPTPIPSEPRDQIASVVVTDANGDTAEADVFLCTPLVLLCRIIQRELGLQEGRVYVWDQKINEPRDPGLFVVLSALVPKCYGNVRSFDPVNNAQVQQSNWGVQVDIDIISKGPEARDRKEEVVMALTSQYAVQQQELNSFSLGKIPTAIRNLSAVDGAAIPYRFNFSVILLYTVTKTQTAEFFDTFDAPTLLVNP